MKKKKKKKKKMKRNKKKKKKKRMVIMRKGGLEEGGWKEEKSLAEGSFIEQASLKNSPEMRKFNDEDDEEEEEEEDDDDVKAEVVVAKDTGALWVERDPFHHHQHDLINKDNLKLFSNDNDDEDDEEEDDEEEDEYLLLQQNLLGNNNDDDDDEDEDAILGKPKMKRLKLDREGIAPCSLLSSSSSSSSSPSFISHHGLTDLASLDAHKGVTEVLMVPESMVGHVPDGVGEKECGEKNEKEKSIDDMQEEKVSGKEGGGASVCIEKGVGGREEEEGAKVVTEGLVSQENMPEASGVAGSVTVVEPPHKVAVTNELEGANSGSNTTDLVLSPSNASPHNVPLDDKNIFTSNNNNNINNNSNNKNNITTDNIGNNDDDEVSSVNSRHTNKSDKNMSDFDGEDVPSDEEIAYINTKSSLLKLHASNNSNNNMASLYHQYIHQNLTPHYNPLSSHHCPTMPVHRTSTKRPFVPPCGNIDQATSKPPKGFLVLSLLLVSLLLLLLWLLLLLLLLLWLLLLLLLLFFSVCIVLLLVILLLFYFGLVVGVVVGDFFVMLLLLILFFQLQAPFSFKPPTISHFFHQSFRIIQLPIFSSFFSHSPLSIHLFHPSIIPSLLPHPYIPLLTITLISPYPLPLLHQ